MSHKNQPHVGKYNIHEWYGMAMLVSGGVLVSSHDGSKPWDTASPPVESPGRTYGIKSTITNNKHIPKHQAYWPKWPNLTLSEPAGKFSLQISKIGKGYHMFDKNGKTTIIISLWVFTSLQCPRYRLRLECSALSSSSEKRWQLGGKLHKSEV